MFGGKKLQSRILDNNAKFFKKIESVSTSQFEVDDADVKDSKY